MLESNQPSHPLSEGRHTSSLHPLSQVFCASPHDLPFVKGFTSEIEKVFLKGNLSCSGQHGSITPSLLLTQRHECVLLIYARTQGCSKPIAGYYQGCPWLCFLHHRAFRITFDSNWWIGQDLDLQHHGSSPLGKVRPMSHCRLSVLCLLSYQPIEIGSGSGLRSHDLLGMNQARSPTAPSRNLEIRFKSITL